MIDLPNLRLTDEQWQAIARKVIAKVIGPEFREAPNLPLEQSNVIDMISRKPIWIKPQG
jgi:hypothetical protein